MLHLQTGSCSRRLRVLLAIWHQMLSGFSCRRAAEPGSHDRYLRNAVTPPLVGELREARVLSTKIRINVVTGPVGIAGTRAMYTLLWKLWIRAYRTLTLCSSCFVLTNKVRLSSTLRILFFRSPSVARIVSGGSLEEFPRRQEECVVLLQSLLVSSGSFEASPRGEKNTCLRPKRA